MRCFRWERVSAKPILASIALFAGLFIAFPACADETPAPDALLQRHGISPDPTGVIKYIRPLDQKQLNALIRQLGAREFVDREKATAYLKGLPLVPIRELETAAESADAEVRYRSQAILRYTKEHDNSPVMIAVLLKISGKEYRDAGPVLLELIPRLENRKLITAAIAAIGRISDETLAPHLKVGLKHKNADVRIASISALTRAVSEKAIPAVRPLLNDPAENVRLSASMSMLSQGNREPLATLCQLLASTDDSIRAGASRVLRIATGKRFGYLAYDRSPARVRAANDWSRWVEEHGATARLKPLNTTASAGPIEFAIVPRSLHVIHRAHSGTFFCVAFSPDGKTLATAGGDKLTHLWDVATARKLKTFHGHTDMVRGVTFSPDGKHLATSSFDKTIRIWNIASGKTVHVLRGHTESVKIIACSPDGKTLASTSSDTTVRLWDIQTGRLIRTLKGHSATTRSVTFSPDGATVVSTSTDQTICLWDIKTGALRHRMKGHTGSVRSVAFTSDGRTMISGSLDKSVRLWDMESGRQRLIMPGHTSSVKCVAVSPDGRLFISAGNDAKVRVWDADNCKQIAILRGHQSPIWHTAFAPDNRTVASCGSGDGSAGSLRIWRIDRLAATP